LGLTLLVGGVLLLVGQCRCVRHAPDRNGAKPWVFVSVTALIVGLVLTLATGALAVLENYPTQQAGWQGAQELTASLTVRILPLTAAGVVVLAVVLFSLFLRAVASCFRDEARSRHLDCFLLFTCFLVGGSLFGLMGSRQLTSLPGFQVSLVACWV